MLLLFFSFENPISILSLEMISVLWSDFGYLFTLIYKEETDEGGKQGFAHLVFY